MASKESSTTTTTTTSSSAPLKREVDELSEEFTEVNQIAPDKEALKKSQDLQNRLVGARLWDIRSKIGVRIAFIIFFMFLLWIQNQNVFNLVSAALNTDKLEKLQFIIGVLVSATLTETYFVLRKIVEWLCKEIDYKEQ